MFWPFVPQRLPNKATTALEERQEILAYYVRLVARRQSNGLFVFGSKGGLGKTKIILETLVEEWTQPVILNGHCTPLSLFTNLQAHPDAVVFLDDCDSLFRNLPALGILRSALWGQGDERLVTYNSSALHKASAFNFSAHQPWAGSVSDFRAIFLPESNQPAGSPLAVLWLLNRCMTSRASRTPRAHCAPLYLKTASRSTQVARDCENLPEQRRSPALSPGGPPNPDWAPCVCAHHVPHSLAIHWRREGAGSGRKSL
jgi:hypothetical protein